MIRSHCSDAIDGYSLPVSVAGNMSNTTPRLSIVLPVGAKDAEHRSAFENTLLSVLENRCQGTEIVVVHDGSYEDPFEIGDEVRFAVADSDNLIDSIAAGCDASWGRYVHILADGFQANQGWCEAALETFAESNVAAVAPMMIDRDNGEDIASGWRDTKSRLMDPCVATGDGQANHPSGVNLLANGGVYLEASFWRREVLRSLTRACGPTDLNTATYAYAQLCRSKDWQIAAAIGSVVTAGDWLETIDGGGFSRTRLLRSIRNHFAAGRSGSAILAAIRGLTSDVGEAIGELSIAMSSVKVEHWFEEDLVYAAEHIESVRHAA